MSDLMIEKMEDVSLATLIILIIAVLTIVKLLTPWFNKLKAHIISKYKKDQKDDNLQKTVELHEKKLIEYANNRIHDREQSFQIQKELVDSISSVNERIDKLATLQQEQYNESLERENKRVRAQLKDRIGQSYRYYHERGEWNIMEKESLEDLVAEYEAAGGNNSFVHDVVASEMYSWKIVECNYKPNYRTGQS